ncbi:hypothetical protein G6O67_006146 [Ophiocordyceps sinensis]|uniref:Uncharacterized protein n=1 Tax=Ophiocordyceps sinensis TaxID=72228 RepID=A0A8H4PMQ2_9HYPO|nr:hypothetical protein G6O67_006146 [Ophiocordyceps sinensis]
MPEAILESSCHVLEAFHFPVASESVNPETPVVHRDMAPMKTDSRNAVSQRPGQDGLVVVLAAYPFHHGSRPGAFPDIYKRAWGRDTGPLEASSVEAW